MGIHTCNPSYSGIRDRRFMRSKPVRTKLARLYPKNKIKTKKGWGMAHFEDLLLISVRPSVQSPEPENKQTKNHKEILIPTYQNGKVKIMIIQHDRI
jgi:hypothetical protein